MSKDIPVGNRVMDVAYYIDKNEVMHTGEALVLACLLKVKKTRVPEAEEQLKEVLNVYGDTQK